MGKNDKQVFVPEGSVGAYVKFNALITPRTKLNTNDVEEMRRRWLNYVNLSDQYNIPLGNKNAQTALGLSWQQINDYCSIRYNDNPERGDFLMYVMNVLGGYREQAVMKGELPAIPTIFAQKNYDGMKDVQDIQVSHTTSEIRDIKSIAERYTDIVDVEFEHHKQIGHKAEQKQKDGE